VTNVTDRSVRAH